MSFYLNSKTNNQLKLINNKDIYENVKKLEIPTTKGKQRSRDCIRNRPITYRRQRRITFFSIYALFSKN